MYSQSIQQNNPYVVPGGTTSLPPTTNPGINVYNVPPANIGSGVPIKIPVGNYQNSYPSVPVPVPQQPYANYPVANQVGAPVVPQATVPMNVPPQPYYSGAQNLPMATTVQGDTTTQIPQQPISNVVPSIYPSQSSYPYDNSSQNPGQVPSFYIPQVQQPSSYPYSSVNPIYPSSSAAIYAPNVTQPTQLNSMKIMDSEKTITWEIPYEEGVSRFVSLDSQAIINVKKISFKNQHINDNGCEILCRYFIFNRFPELKKINLTNCNLSDSSLNSLLSLIRNTPLPKLKELNISENSFSDSAVRTLKSLASKHIEIVHNKMKSPPRVQKPSNSSLLHGVLTYQVHTESIGWLPPVSENSIAGPVGKKKRIECVRLFYNGPGEIQIMGHVQDIGWMPQVQANQDCGTTGQSKRLEAIRAWFTGIPGLQLEYRAYVEKKGWQEWCKDGMIAGTTGKGKYIEGLQFRFV